MSPFATFSTDSKSASNSAFFDTQIAFFEQIFCFRLAFFAKSNADEMAKKAYFLNVS
jgi:hypothetical protein